MATIADLARTTRMVVHGGHDYMDEKPECFPNGHPILTIEMGGTIRHFKCTSLNVFKSDKYKNIQNHFYLLQDPSHCQLDKTLKSITHSNIVPAIDFNHSVYLYKDETPPLIVHPTGKINVSQYQTQFDLSERDKIGVLRKLIQLQEITKCPVRTPYVSKHACEVHDLSLKNKYPTHPIQVAESLNVSLNMDDLKWDSETIQKASNLLMQ